LQATGAGYSFQLLKTDRVGVAFFGDGAVNNGAFHEGLNLASICRLPVLFVCENNQYATEISFAYAPGTPGWDAGQRLRDAWVTLDGNDVVAVYQAGGEAVARARAGGPTLLECRTYRTRAHAEGMRDVGYRTQEEVDRWKAQDPIARCRSYLLQKQAVAVEALEQIEADVQNNSDRGGTLSRNSPWPEAATACQHAVSEPAQPASH
jgi:2-oxoisovalerate dehydrogenase E1 component